MQIELSDVTMHILTIALAWYLVWNGAGHIVGSWFHVRENRRREREAERRKRNDSLWGGDWPAPKKTKAHDNDG